MLSAPEKVYGIFGKIALKYYLAAGLGIVVFMGLKEDVLAGIAEVLGADSAGQVVGTFDDPKKYPKDFLDEYLFFMQKLIGDGAAERKAIPLYRKYGVKYAIMLKSSLRA